jgi:Tol biopolymer transport system component
VQRALPLLVLASAGCGRLNFDDARVGAVADAADGPDASAALCVPGAPFGVPVPISELNTTFADGTLRLAPDELSGYFWSRRTGSARIYYAVRPDLAQPFTVTEVTGLSTMDHDLDPTLSTDGSLLVFRHNIPGDELWTARRVDAITFASPLAMTNLNLASVESQPYLQESGPALMFSSDRNGGNFDIWQSTLTGNTYGVPVRQLALDAGGSAEGDPVLSSDGLTIYFRSDRPSPNGAFDIYVATRPTTAMSFGAPALVPNVNSSADDGPSFISSNGCRLYISSDRLGDNDIFVATRGS